MKRFLRLMAFLFVGNAIGVMVLVVNNGMPSWAMVFAYAVLAAVTGLIASIWKGG